MLLRFELHDISSVSCVGNAPEACHLYSCRTTALVCFLRRNHCPCVVTTSGMPQRPYRKQTINIGIASNRDNGVFKKALLHIHVGSHMYTYAYRKVDAFQRVWTQIRAQNRQIQIRSRSRADKKGTGASETFEPPSSDSLTRGQHRESAVARG